MGKIENADKRGYLETPFRLFHLEDTRGGDIPYHYHEFHKLILFLSGDVRYLIEGRNYLLKEGDILLIPAFAIHQPMISGEEAYSRYILWIRPESLERWNLTDGFSICEEQNAYLLKRNRYDRSELMGLLQRLEKTETEKEYGWEAMKEALFIEIATQVSRAVLQTGPSLREHEELSDPRIDAILQYMNQNLTEDLSVEALSGHFYLSKSWLMHRFKEIANCTIHQYVLQKRLILSTQKLLEQTSAEQAARESGFTDYSTFLRAFRRVYGVTPREYVRYHTQTDLRSAPEYNE